MPHLGFLNRPVARKSRQLIESWLARYSAPLGSLIFSLFFGLCLVAQKMPQKLGFDKICNKFFMLVLVWGESGRLIGVSGELCCPSSWVSKDNIISFYFLSSYCAIKLRN